MKSENNLELIFSLSWIEIGPQHLKLVKLELVSKALNYFWGIVLFFRDWVPGTLTGGV